MLLIDLLFRRRWWPGLVLSVMAATAHGAEVAIQFLPAKTKDGYPVVSVPSGSQLLIQVSPAAFANAKPKSVSLVWGAPPSGWPSKGPGISSLPLDADGRATAPLTFPPSQISAFGSMSLVACVHTTLPGWDHETNACSDTTYFFFEKYGGLTTDALVTINQPGANLTLPADGGQVGIFVHSNLLAAAPKKSVYLKWKYANAPGSGWTPVWPNDPTLPQNLPISELSAGHGEASATVHFKALAQYKLWSLHACVQTVYSEEVCSKQRQFYVKTSDIGGGGSDAESAAAPVKPDAPASVPGAGTTLPAFGARVPKAVTGKASDPAASLRSAPDLRGVAEPKLDLDRGVAPTAGLRRSANPQFPPSTARAEPRTAPRRAVTAPANPPAADLRVTKVYTDSDCNLWATIANTGKTAISTQVADAYWVNDKASSGGVVALNLAPGQSTQHKFGTGLSGAGSAQLKYQLDTKNALAETNENDNAGQATVTCRVARQRMPQAPAATRTAPAEPAPPAPGRLGLPSR